jgi:TatD DNase family protein
VGYFQVLLFSQPPYFFPNMIDTHCHLNLPPLSDDQAFLIEQSRTRGITNIVVPGTDKADSQAAILLSHQFAGVHAAVGIHPTNTANQPDLSEIVPMVKQAVAVGEIGLDYFHQDNPALREIQKQYFSSQLELAQNARLPVIIHCREAFQDTLEVLGRYPSVRGVVHCFSGTKEQARSCLDQGLMLSFTGILTYAKNQDLRATAGSLPRNRVMVETDAPYLAPEGSRGDVCKPWHVWEVVKTLAGIWEEDMEMVAEQVTDNARQFFSLYG